jgi:phosphoribosyl-AMP cyclohydrolase
MTMFIHVFAESLKYDEHGLIPAIVQDADTNQVLMMAWMNKEAVGRTLSSGETWFWSRSRQEFWHKGETSGNIQKVVEIRVDCDTDTLLVLVKPAGPACHTGETSCFYRTESELVYHDTEWGKGIVAQFGEQPMRSGHYSYWSENTSE